MFRFGVKRHHVVFPLQKCTFVPSPKKNSFGKIITTIKTLEKFFQDTNLATIKVLITYQKNFEKRQTLIKVLVVAPTSYKTHKLLFLHILSKNSICLLKELRELNQMRCGTVNITSKLLKLLLNGFSLWDIGFYKALLPYSYIAFS